VPRGPLWKIKGDLSEIEYEVDMGYITGLWIMNKEG